MKPARLRPGSTVEVVAPAGPVPEDLLDKGVAILRSWDLEVRVGEHVTDRHPRLGYLAGQDAVRAAELTRAWCDPSVDAVLCARGGYGSLRMVDLVDWDAMASRSTPPVFVGSSDITVLHEEIAARLRVPTFFGPMVATDGFVSDPVAAEHLRRSLLEPESVRSLTGPATVPVVDGVARGVLRGGNASLLAAVLGAEDAVPPPDGCLVLLEDITEDPYRLDGILTQLLRAGWFTGVNGILLGSWTNCGPPADVRAVLDDLVGNLGVPTVWELGFGHCDGQLTMPLGVEAELDAANGTVTLLESPFS
ncbi:S66 peptidase family protein [Labedaea rhizosphaerae]|uniref:Muramoyltetrapeptide carboxypeptidase n=1 Tax=Labedaea rhizosphaerae TaxID=598644 RepID=A0A4R6RVX1_LABRH|nr:LD-carboxypeptidase [Labedaea rhizosphaerae]TDP91151.1 muramoyltetrapeptide carboxypeptidase [Labedaea rhizosphaerae]